MKSPRATLLFIFLIAILIYSQLWGAPPLTWDDDSNIFNNPYYHAGWWGIFWQSSYFGLYVPVTSTVWQVIFNLGGGSVWPFRALNLLLHLGNTFLVYRLLSGLATRWQIRSVWAVLIGTALFALHPMQVEAVAWISGGRDLLSTFFALLAVAIYFRDDKPKTFALASLAFAAAVLSKPGVVVLPVIVGLFDVFLRPEVAKRTVPRLTVWFGLSLWSIYQTIQAQTVHIPDIAWGLRPWIMLDTYAFYARKLVLPWPLTGNYGRTPDVVLAQTRTLVPAILFLIALIALAVWAWRKDRRALPIAAGWLLVLAPVSGLVAFAFQKISGVADHYHYPAMTIVAVGVMWLIERLSRFHRPVYLLSGIMLTAFAGVSAWHVRAFTSDVAFFSEMAAHAPKSYSTAIGMSIVECQDRKNFDEGVRWTELALVARPNDIMALANQAYCHLHSGNHFRVIELDYYLDHMDLEMLEKTQPTAYSSLLASIGTSFIELREFEKGYQYLCEAYRVKPAEPNHARNLEVAQRILREQGLNPVCEESVVDDGEDQGGGIDQLMNPGGGDED